MSHGAFHMWSNLVRRQCRADFEVHQLNAYQHAAEACRGRLLNRRGMEAGISSLSLFEGPSPRALAYASEELIDHWRINPRPTFQSFEHVWFEAFMNERGIHA